MKTSAMVMALWLGLSPFAMAQNSKPMSETELMQKLDAQGYSNVKLQPASGTSGTSAAPTSATGGTSSTTTATPTNPHPTYLGVGTKDGKESRFEIDAITGEVKTVAQP